MFKKAGKRKNSWIVFRAINRLNHYDARIKNCHDSTSNKINTHFLTL